jgi:hypothetical protein
MPALAAKAVLSCPSLIIFLRGLQTRAFPQDKEGYDSNASHEEN